MNEDLILSEHNLPLNSLFSLFKVKADQD